MPLIKLHVSVPVSEDRRDALLAAASRILAETTGKPEKYVMAVLETGAACYMAGKPAAGAFVDIRGIGGLGKETNAKLSLRICDLLKKELKIEAVNVYLTFTDVPATNWGWNGATFG